MEQRFKLNLLYFTIPVTFLILLFLSFWMNHSFFTAIMATFITWSFYILCIPANHGKLILGIPYKVITGKKLLYPERIIWPAALIFSVITMISYVNIYQTTIITHLFYNILSTPRPQWLIIFVSFLGTFYKYFIGYERFFKHKYFHCFIRLILVILGILTFFYLSYNELVILLDVMV
ncbi:hypothetical protein GF385_01990 [Candidatus Dependentiae bacterium]|nr:hypothetical protein [Candidatus Dependentiae bacterium]